MRLGFLGLGWIGRKRLDTIAHRTDVIVAALADADAGKLTSAAESYPQASTQQLEAMLSMELDGVVIATPNASHAQQAIAFLERGVPVFCQKPLAIDAQDTRRVLSAAQTANKLLAVDYSYRHVQGMQVLRQMILSGELGTVRAIDMVFHNAYGPNKQWCFDRARSGGGCLLDLGVHLIDLALWLQDAPPMRVSSSHLFKGDQRASTVDVEDLAFVELEQDNGALVRLACSWNAQIGCDAQIQAHIHATKGAALWSNLNGSFVNFRIDVLRGNSGERLATSFDDWGPGALIAWIDRLSVDTSFDHDALRILEGARLIDEAYCR